MSVTTTTTYVPNPAGVARLFSPVGDFGLWMQMKVEQVEQIAQTRCPRDSGELASTIEGRVIAGPATSGTGTVAIGQVQAGGDSAPYAVAVHEGTRPHSIEPKNAGVLVFPSRRTGATVFTTHVDHPGTKGQPFLLDALRVAIRV